ncbi:MULTISPECIES: hypothetical protein [Streptomyces]|uniref:Uncharacterized protein n=2 Tax=Streptomyces TaxID=1883 RepID=A0A1E7LPQ2_9ACTN|nr:MULTISPECIES: hypothetical protein [Streptomyces]NEB35870.1 hypothetical protein [Streptomyces sp. SID14515]OEV18151.1 hypothetical protein AN221_23705 [Streptomyces nanshensis]
MAAVQIDRAAVEALARGEQVKAVVHRAGKAAEKGAEGRSPVRTGAFKAAGMSTSTKVRRTKLGRWVTARVYSHDEEANIIVLGSAKTNRKPHRVFNLGDFAGGL